MRSNAMVMLAIAIFILFFPVLLLDYSILSGSPELPITGTAKEVVGFFSADPAGSAVELAYAGFSKRELLSGRLPLWSPFQGLGHPFAADSVVSALFAPINLFRLVLPARHWSVVYIFNLLLGCYFVYLLCRIYGFSRPASIIGGLAFAAMGTTQLYMAVPSIGLVITWIPLLLYGIERVLLPHAGTNRLPYIILPLAAYGVATGGHPTITLLAGMFTLFYTCVRLLQLRSPLSDIGRLVLIGGIALSIAAVQWLPFARYVLYRGNTFDDYSNHFDFQHLPAFFIPLLYGNLHTSASVTTPPVHLGDYWSFGWLPPGLLVLVTAGSIGLVRRKSGPGPIAIAIVAIGLLSWAFAVPPFSSIWNVPFFNRVRGHYIPVTISFVLPVIAALGADLLQLRRVRILHAAVAAAATLAVMMLCCAWVLFKGGVGDIQATGFTVLRSGLAALWLIVACMAIWWVTRRDTDIRLYVICIAIAGLSALSFFPWASPEALARARQSGLVCCVLLATFICVGKQLSMPLMSATVAMTILGCRLWIMGAPGHLPRKFDLFERPAYTSVLIEKFDPSFRAYGLEGFLFPNFSSAFGYSEINLLTGFVSLQVDRFFRTFLDANQPPDHFGGMYPAFVPSSAPQEQFFAHRKFWNYIAVRYIVSRSSLRETPAAQPNRPPGTLMGIRTGANPAVLSEASVAFTCPPEPVSSVCVYLGDYGRRMPGRITATIQTADHRVVAERTIDSWTIQNMGCARFEFTAPLCLKQGDTRLFQLAYKKPSYDPAAGIAIFRAPNDSGFEHEIFVKHADELMKMGEDPVSHAVIWENRSAQPRAYIAAETAQAGDWIQAQQKFGAQHDLRRIAWVEEQASCTSNSRYPQGQATASIKSIKIESNRVLVDLEAASSGTFVLVDAFMPGWKATVDGREQRVFRVNGIVRGTCIDSPGPHHVAMIYDPPEWRWAVLLSTGGLLVLAFLVTRCTHLAPLRTPVDSPEPARAKA